jgi:energy-coupling factor transport system ATP-binding protein
MPIVVKNLTFIYDEGFVFAKKALDNVSINIEEGEIVGIIGHTGSGKSTLVQHLNGLIKPKKPDSVIVDGVDIYDAKVNLKEIRQKVGLVFQYPEMQLFEETVEKEIAFGPKNLGISDEEIKERVKEALEMVSLDYAKYKDRSPFLLSGGEKRRIAIAGILAMKPKYFILDEPTAGLDPLVRVEILKELQNINYRGTTIVIVSHDMDEISKIAKRIYVLNNGCVALSGTSKYVFSQFDKIKELRLSLPQITEILYLLNSKCREIDFTELDISKAVDEILIALKRKGKWK